MSGTIELILRLLDLLARLGPLVFSTVQDIQVFQKLTDDFQENVMNLTASAAGDDAECKRVIDEWRARRGLTTSTKEPSS